MTRVWVDQDLWSIFDVKINRFPSLESFNSQFRITLWHQNTKYYHSLWKFIFFLISVCLLQQMIRNWETHGFHHFYDPITDFCIIFKAMICRNTVRLRWTKLFFLFFWFLDRCPSHSWRNQLTTARKLSFLKCFWLNTHEKTRFLHNILLQKYPCVVHISCTIHCKRDITFLNAREKRRTREMAEKIFFWPVFLVSWSPGTCVSSKFWGNVNVRSILLIMCMNIPTPQDGRVPMAPDKAFSPVLKSTPGVFAPTT